jgi:hypothetical protein
MIRNKMMTSEKEFEFWEEKEVGGSQNTFVGGRIVLIKDDIFFCKSGLVLNIFSSSLVKRLE